METKASSDMEQKMASRLQVENSCSELSAIMVIW